MIQAINKATLKNKLANSKKMFCKSLLFLKTTKLKKSTVGKNKYKKIVLEKSIAKLQIIITILQQHTACCYNTYIIIY